MGLRFFRVTGWGRVAEICGRIAGCAHPTEKSVPNFRNASIHRLSSWQVNSQKLNFRFRAFWEVRKVISESSSFAGCAHP